MQWLENENLNMSIPMTPNAWHRIKEGLGIWEGRGKGAATGVGVSPTARRWDGKPETSMGALTIMAIRKAIEDAGITPSQIDGIVMTPESSTGVTNDPNTRPPRG